ncbi:hypothetical protein SBOR_4704 [Sclerotinia borealis F-4128]|uniref:Uncharacterized protein n=1 Tax=Sclerotinia borealis (strain F-4128) TaxID=1432307 RepID=W9CDT8_SCLBF|nr:hypothetical protein SBOR_4704 [Sclerotinia borealis F-4128]
MDWAHNLPPLDEGSNEAVELTYQDQCDLLMKRVDKFPMQSQLAEQSGLIGGMKYIEGFSKLWHPNAGDAYINYFTQVLAAQIFWPNFDFPGVDPDPVYTQVWSEYFDAAVELVHRKYPRDMYDLSKEFADKLFVARRNAALTANQVKNAQESREYGTTAERLATKTSKADSNAIEGADHNDVSSTIAYYELESDSEFEKVDTSDVELTASTEESMEDGYVFL